MADLPPANPDDRPDPGLGITGVVFAVAGLATLGIMSPIGLIISLVAFKGPGRRVAVVGITISAAGIALGAFLVLRWFAAWRAGMSGIQG